MFEQEQIQAILGQLTPLQKDIVTLVALPQLLEWTERWLSTSARQNAVAGGLVRRGLLREVTDQPGEYEATPLGMHVAAFAFREDGVGLDADLDHVTTTWFTDVD